MTKRGSLQQALCVVSGGQASLCGVAGTHVGYFKEQPLSLGGGRGVCSDIYIQVRRTLNFGVGLLRATSFFVESEAIRVLFFCF